MSIKERLRKGMGCYTDIPKGWKELVYQLDLDLSVIDPDYVIDQIKEKFGGLRYYISSSVYTEEMRNLIDKAEEKSFNMCLFCGNLAEPKNYDGWYATICKECQND